MFASKTTREIVIGEHTVTIRKLSAHRLDEARAVRQQAFGEITKRLGSEFIAQAAANEAKAEPQTEPEKRKIRNTAYDRLTVLMFGIGSWTASPTVTRDLLEDLEEPTVELLFEAILDLTFEATETRKKD